jgi:hypothetical protein
MNHKMKGEAVEERLTQYSQNVHVDFIIIYNKAPASARSVHTHATVTSKAPLFGSMRVCECGYKGVHVIRG